MISRRKFLKAGAVAGAGLLVPRTSLAQGLYPQESVTGGAVDAQEVALIPPLLLDAVAHPKFVNPLPNPLDPSFVFAPTSGTHYDIGMYQFQQSLGLVDPVLGTPLMTTVWGYGNALQGATYPGRTFIAQKDTPITVQWTNNLLDGANPLPHLLPVDMSLHMAHTSTGVPVVPHVHGGHTESDSDGLPEYWWTPGESETGPRFVKSLYTYDNDQEAGTIWYHDHALGLTRLNVYAGLAGFYIIRDDVDTGAADNPLGLPAFPYEVPVVIQDRLFTAEGQLYYPSMPEVPGAPDPSALPEFFGNFILVNGQAWPVLDVEPRKYRLRLLNGSDSRFYSLWINAGASGADAGPVITVIGTDTGLLDAPVPVTQLTIGPGERYDVVVDFAAFNGATLILRNNARSPFPKGMTVDPRTDGQIMAFRVILPLDTTVPDNPLPATLRPSPIVPLVPTGPTRQLILFEGLDQYGRLQPMLGTLQDGTLLWDDHLYPISENPDVDAVEIWEVYNATMDAHPIHLHLVAFQLLGRQKYKAIVTPKLMEAHDGSESTGGILSNVKVIGQLKGPEPYEAGWKDTAIMYPGEVTRVIAKFDRPGRYVWHCHILSHEDHEMMRPYHVGALPDPPPMP